MNNAEVDFVLTIPIAPAAHLNAQTLSQQQTDPKKAKQVYLNAVVVQAVNFYFQCMEIETDLAASSIWHPVVQKFMDVADLDLKNIGKLECRPVSPGEDFVAIPAEVRSDRIGCVAVEIVPSQQEVKLLGFVKKGSRAKFPISELEPIENLLEYLDRLKTEHFDELKPVHLSQWLHNVFDIGWQTAEQLFESKPELQFAFRSTQLLENSALANVRLPVKRGKSINLEWGKEQVALFVELTAHQKSEIDISVEVCPTKNQTFLPNNLQLMVLDEQGETLMQARANSTENLLFELIGEPGEYFTVKLVLGDFSVTEQFLI
ncbi:DUF1822 family protein [Tychonema sp. LEGE 07203]|uniref:DUF1822 family protein n=1 Tax=Tychonema sp. LEGE 07203 TaxID=1828671 RepID=UPI0018817921|nr:DUF1822 family protein [Tychonema sp. LEGE 07203]MBE9096500.1 DUF1822 family protein [Tychonema sp. LEGE 07203]